MGCGVRGWVAWLVVVGVEEAMSVVVKVGVTEQVTETVEVAPNSTLRNNAPKAMPTAFNVMPSATRTSQGVPWQPKHDLTKPRCRAYHKREKRLQDKRVIEGLS